MSACRFPQYIYGTSPATAFLTQTPSGPAIAYQVATGQPSIMPYSNGLQAIQACPTAPGGGSPPVLPSTPTSPSSVSYVEYCQPTPTGYSVQQVPATTAGGNGGPFDSVLYPTQAPMFQGCGYLSVAQSCDSVMGYQQQQQQHIASHFVPRPINQFATLAATGQFHH